MKPHRLFFRFALTVWRWKAGSSQEGAETSKLLWRAQPPGWWWLRVFKPGQPGEKAVRWSSNRAPHFAAKCHVVFWAPVRQSARTLMTRVAESKKTGECDTGVWQRDFQEGTSVFQGGFIMCRRKKKGGCLSSEMLTPVTVLMTCTLDLDLEVQDWWLHLTQHTVTRMACLCQFHVFGLYVFHLVVIYHGLDVMWR